MQSLHIMLNYLELSFGYSQGLHGGCILSSAQVTETTNENDGWNRDNQIKASSTPAQDPLEWI
jgi:hypothetical protein